MDKKLRPLPPAPANEKKPGITDGIRAKFSQFESLFLGTAVKYNLPFLKIWLSAYFHPAQAWEKEKKSASLKSAAINLLFFYFAFAAVFFVFAVISHSLLGKMQAKAGAAPLPNPSDYALQILAIGPVTDTLFMFVSLFLLFVSSRLLGGKASFKEQSYMVSLLFCGAMSLATVFILPSFISLLLTSLFTGFSMADMLVLVLGPLIALVFFIGLFASIIYGLFSLYRMVKCANQISGVRAAGAIACTVALIILLNVLLLALV